MNDYEYLESLGLSPYCLSDVPMGWRPLVTKLVKDLVAMGWDKSIGQVKEKFGGLRFYADNVTEDMFRLISEAEDASYSICSSCSSTDGVSQTKYGTYCINCVESISKQVK